MSANTSPTYPAHWPFSLYMNVNTMLIHVNTMMLS